MEQRQIYDHRGTVIREVRYSGPEEAVFVTREICDPLLDKVQRERELTQSKDMKLAARIPITVVEQAMREGWFNDKARWRRWLNDPDNRGFRVYQGRV